MQIEPEDLTLLGERILVRKYRRPEKVQGLFVPEAYRQENSRSLWEVVKSSEAADRALGVTLKPDWILITPLNAGVFVGGLDGVRLPEYDDGSRPEPYVILAERVVKVVPWTEE